MGAQMADFVSNAWTWLGTHAGAIGAVVGVLSVLPIVWAIVQYIVVKRAEAKRNRFETFHRLIKELVEPDAPDKPMKLDRQVAIVFELRGFKHYYPVTVRILRGWRNSLADPIVSRLVAEIDLTIAHIERHTWRKVSWLNR